jgi:hypothetical protein
MTARHLRNLKTNGTLGWTLAAALALPAIATAAPLDALLSAVPAASRGEGAVSLELGADRVNDKLDVFGLRSSDPRYAGTQIGDYQGRHLRASVELGDWRLEGSTWQRALQDRADVHHFRSWELAGQYRLGSADDGRRHWALRASAWGNQAGELVRSTNTRLNTLGLDTQVSAVQIQQPRDRQSQLDLIFSQQWRAHTFSAFAGAGQSRVDNQGITGTSRTGNCPYQLRFGATELVATPTGSCASTGLIITVENRVLPYDALGETRYGARFLHLGGSHRWQGEFWGTRLGYEYQRWQRERIDALIEQRGGTAYTTNHTLVVELSARLAPSVSAVLRAQAMRHQFVGELPLAYTTLSANRFGKTYGFATAAVQADF